MNSIDKQTLVNEITLAIARKRALVIALLLSALPACGDAARDRLEAIGRAADPLTGEPTVVVVDVLPGVYPNQLTAAETIVTAAISLAHHGEGAGRRALRAWATSSADPGAPRVAAIRIDRRDVDDDDRREVVASFAVSDLRAAGLLNPGTSRLRVELETRDGTTVSGEDRLFDQGAFVVKFPAPSGENGVGTTSTVVFDTTRIGPTPQGRALVLRLWYPTAANDVQPARYYLNDLEAELNARAGQFPANIFDSAHASSVVDARPARRLGRRPTLLMSTGLGVSLTFYSQIAEDLASHGYVVVGIEHPVGSGIVVYPDGSVSAIDPATIPLDDLNRDWTTDLEFVASWLIGDPGRSMAPAVRAALALVDTSRLGALGHSFGGAASVWAASETPLLRASVDLDGRFFGDMLRRAPTTPVLLMLAESHTAESDPTLRTFLDHAEGQVYTARVVGAEHNDFADSAALVTALARIDPNVHPADFQLGPIDPGRALVIESAYVRAFFGATLSGKASRLLEGDAVDFPEVGFEVR